MSVFNDWENAADMQAAFSQKGRIQIKNILKKEIAAKLYDEVAALEWRLVLNENQKHLDIHPLQLAQLTPQQLRHIKKSAQARAAYEFQYLFENYPVYDISQAGKPISPLIQDVYNALNDESFRTRLAGLTGLSSDFCDIQATRYRAGHFLTLHDDGIAGKNRQMAFVLNLSKRWRSSWGGALQFTAQDGQVDEEFLPVFNSLSLFKVPQPHRVMPVRSLAKSPRLSLTGWFRTY